MPAQTEPTTRIQLCGRLQVEWAGKRIERDLPGRQGRLLFCYLVLNRHRPVRRDELVAALWADDEARLESRPCWRHRCRACARCSGPTRSRAASELTLALPDDAGSTGKPSATGISRARAPLSCRRPGGRDRQPHVQPSRSPSAACFPASRRHGSTSAAAELRDLGSRRSSSSRSSAPGWEGRSCRAPSRQHAPRSRPSPFRESARAALIEVLRARGQRRGGPPDLRGDAAPPARGAGDGARARCSAELYRAAARRRSRRDPLHGVRSPRRHSPCPAHFPSRDRLPGATRAGEPRPVRRPCDADLERLTSAARPRRCWARERSS